MKHRPHIGIRRQAAILATQDPRECWDWPGAMIPSGYGAVSANLDDRGWRTWRAHRAVYTILVGPVPPTVELDHLCRNRRCVNPAHLELVSPKENRLRGVGAPAVNAKKTHCRRGHEFTPDNTIRVTTPCGFGRKCRQCGADRRRAKGIPEKGTATHCRRGHQFTPGNTITRPNGRTCRTCYNAGVRAWRHRQKKERESA